MHTTAAADSFPFAFPHDGSGASPDAQSEPANVPHRRRPSLPAGLPVLVRVRLVRGLESLRKPAQIRVIERAFHRANGRFGVRLKQLGVRDDHLQLLVEPPDRVELGRGMKGLNVRIAHGLNRLLGRKGQVVAERYYARILRTPEEVRAAITSIGKAADQPRPIVQMISIVWARAMVATHGLLLRVGPTRPPPS